MRLQHCGLANLLHRLESCADEEKKVLFYSALVDKVNSRLDYFASKNQSWAYKYRLSHHQNITPEIIDSLYQRNIPSLFGPEHIVMYANAETKEIVFDPQANMFLPTIRTKNRIIFESPLTKSVESWYSPSFSATTKHEHYSKNPYASKLVAGVKRYDVESETFNAGLGVLSQHNKMFIYHIFDKVIGEVQDKQTKVFKLQVDRKKIYRRHGIEMHGYPVLEQELLRTPRGFYEKLLG